MIDPNLISSYRAETCGCICITSTENGMQSQVLASLSAKNNVLAHTAAAEAGASTMNNKQHQHDPKRNLMKEFVDEIGRGSFGRAEAKERIKK